MAAITFPDAAKVVIDRLRTALPTLTFCHEVPNIRPEVFVRVYRVGGPRSNLVVDAASLAVESWAPDVDTAETNAQTVRGQLNALHEQAVNPAICYIEEFSGPAELPDPLSGSRRITWTAAVHLRGQ